MANGSVYGRIKTQTSVLRQSLGTQNGRLIFASLFINLQPCTSDITEKEKANLQIKCEDSLRLAEGNLLVGVKADTPLITRIISSLLLL
ncbi:hypothetical protein NIES3974_08660 [Calothrix sp. NIES-3974]|nr:hypothetical protein NIES3974_08660 [Calothrix sp. NIES-3974]